MKYIASDLSLRLVEVWFDTLWVYHMASNVDRIAKHLLLETSKISSKTGNMQLMVSQLENVRSALQAKQFEDICKAVLEISDANYPGFEDVGMIAKSLVEPPSRAEKVTLPLTFQCVFYKLCDFLLTDPVGDKALKLVVLPFKRTHATYDICRQQWSRLMLDHVSIVKDGLHLLLEEVSMDSPDSLPNVSETPPHSPIAPGDLPNSPVKTPSVSPVQIDSLENRPVSPAKSPQAFQTPPPPPTPPVPPTPEVLARKFPVIDLSSDEEES